MRSVAPRNPQGAQGTMRGMRQAGRSDRALAVGPSARVTVAATLTAVALVSGSVVGEHLSGWAPAGPALLLLAAVLGAGLAASGAVRGTSELVAVGVCAVSLTRPGRARLKTVPRGRARLVPEVSAPAR